MKRLVVSLSQKGARFAEKHRWSRAALGSIKAFRGHHMVLPSAHFAFNAFLGIFPLLLFASAVIGFVLNSRPAFEERVFQSMYDIMPELGDQLESMINSVIVSRRAVGLIGLVGLLWSATRISVSLETGLNFVWGGERRSFLMKKVRALGVLALFFLLAAAAVVVHFLSSNFTSWITDTYGPGWSFLSQVAGNIASLALSFGVFLVIYRFVPTRKFPSDSLLRGALSAAVLYFLLLKLLNFYLTTVSKAELLYGSIGVIIGIMIWLYLVGVVIFLGAEMTAQLAGDELPAG